MYHADRDIVPGANIQNGYYGDNGNTMTSASMRRIDNYVPCTPGSGYLVYCIPAISSSRIRVHEYDADKNWLRQIVVTGPWEINAEATAFWTASADAAYYRFSCPNYTVLHAGEGTSFAVSFPTPPGTVYGGELDVVNGKLRVTMAETDLGEGNWTRTTAGRYYYSNAIASLVKAVENTSVANVRCDHLTVASANSVDSGSGDLVGVAISGNIRARFDDMPGTKEEFKTAVSGWKLVYELAEPVEYDLTPEEVTTLLGSNTLWADCGPVEVEYQKRALLYMS